MPAARKLQVALPPASPPCASVTGSEVSPCCLLQNRVVQRQIGHQFLQPAVFLLQILQPLCLLYLHPSVLPSPTVVRLLSDPQLPADFPNFMPLAQENL